jgi:hypothetical protein
MSRKSSIDELPERILAEINLMLAEGKWTLDQIVDYLSEAGHPKSRSAVGRHKQDIERVAGRLRESRQITDALTQELGEAAAQGRQGRLLVEMARTLVFDLLMKLQRDGDDALEPRDVAFLGKGLAELGRALRFDQDFETRIREQVAKEEREKAAKVADTAAKKAGISAETRKTIERDILGLTR